MAGRQRAWGAPNVVLQQGGLWRRFADPARVVVAHSPHEVGAALRAIARAVDDEGLHAAGYLAYEAGAAYGLSTHPPDADGPPLLWFGLFGEGEVIAAPTPGGAYRFGDWRPSLDYPTYAAAIDHIKQAIAAGDTYQANFTFRLRATFDGEPWALFADLSGAQRANYCAYIDLGRHVICSASPELFFRLDGATLEARPMKGTAPRGLTTVDDRRQIDWLRGSEKNRAENVMIVDMIRNDFGRVARVGSVQVPALFTIERYPTLLQMTSTVTAQTGAPLTDVLAATFPCASITGAPKVRTMQLLHELERGPRGVYTGAIGSIAPGRRAQFNVAIRTAVIDRAHGRATYGVGSGIVWDSDAAAEYDECLLKARVLAAPRQTTADFQLIETLRWTPDEGYFLLDRHLARLADSAEYCGFRCDRAAVALALADLAAGLAGPSKARLLLDRAGRIEVAATALPAASPEPVRVGLARRPIAADDARLYHKTTRREPYELARATRPDCDDVILWNEHGELTEASVANIILELDGRQVTPPVACGLLAGTLRAQLLAEGEIMEQVLRPDDLARASRLWLINSVRGRQSAVFKP
ncbi:Para-aminobenzoate synthase, subunit I [Candidatus Promineifilum breve]|uniref:Para-aminobenzoate synthase, subunit I n=1 Tax=Candidatus Promineifilum breve TaxID=1806508 RepID=A0A160T508_9CHLR|nr:aminodeoxychorismate synthase component I [Candidatus Promineifilum breve]CUS04974.2 Para-aminobenzoate synthase, subunit I [Candidatus Promineifilum breve]